MTLPPPLPPPPPPHPPLAVRGEDARCAARAIPASVARLLAARCDPGEWCSGAGREPSATMVSKASRQPRWAVRRSLQEPSWSCKFRGSLSSTPLIFLLFLATPTTRPKGLGLGSRIENVWFAVYSVELRILNYGALGLPVETTSFITFYGWPGRRGRSRSGEGEASRGGGESQGGAGHPRWTGDRRRNRVSKRNRETAKRETKRATV